MLEMYPELLTVREVADILRVDRSYVYRLIRTKRLTAMRLTAHKTRIAKTDFESFLARTRSNGSNPSPTTE